MTTSWYETPHGQKRLRKERDAVTEFFPNLFWAYLDPTSGEVHLDGELTSNAGTMYRVMIALPDNYPRAHARSYIHDLPTEVAQRRHEFHISSDGQIDLYHPDDDVTVLDVICRTAEWIYAMEGVLHGGRWLSE